MAGLLLIGLDSSTQSTTACVWTPEGELVSRGSSPLSVERPRPGWAEQPPQEWAESACAALRAALTDAELSRVAGMGVAFQRETFALLDAQGRPVRPAMLWLDVRAEAEAQHLADALGRGAYQELTGKPAAGKPKKPPPPKPPGSPPG